MPAPTPATPIPFVTDDDFYYPPVSGNVYADSEDKYLRSVFVYPVMKNPISGEEDLLGDGFAYLDEAGTKPLWADVAVDLFKKDLLVAFYTDDIEGLDGNVMTDVPFMFRVNVISPVVNDAGVVVGVRLIVGTSEFIAPNRPSASEATEMELNEP